MWKEVKTARAKQEPERVRKSPTTGHPAAPKAQKAGPFTEQMDLGEGWNHVVRRGRVVKATTITPPLIQIPLLSRSRRCLSSLKWLPPGRRPGLRSLSPNPQQPLNRLQRSRKRKQPQVSNPRPPNPQPPTWWSPNKVPPPHSRKSLFF